MANKVSFITTIYNEEQTIHRLLDSLLAQTKLPDEIIIADGGSTDNTLSVISLVKFPKSIKQVKILIKKGNRSVGRNEAIKHATGDIIVCSDSGNILDKDWIKNIIAPFSSQKDVDVVAGYYEGYYKTNFEKSLIPYVLVMPDKVNPDSFLPATRSIAFTKKIWEKVGGFDERFSHNEDYVFAKELQKVSATIRFARDAIVYWIPRSTFKQSFIMFFRFAYGDAEAKIIRPKVGLLFVRYLIAFALFVYALKHSSFLLVCLLLCAISYLLWAIQKNYKYVRHWQAFIYLPALQLLADASVLIGTVLGTLKVWVIRRVQ